MGADGLIAESERIEMISSECIGIVTLIIHVLNLKLLGIDSRGSTGELIPFQIRIR